MVAGDTMNYWIAAHRENLLKVLAELDVLLINDQEARMISGETTCAARGADGDGAGTVKSLVVKHGEYGATVFASEGLPFRSPGLPLGEVVDPTGAGDSFAGGFYGYIASQGGVTPEVLRSAMFYGSVMGSFACERFGTERLQEVTRAEIDERFGHLREISHL